MDAIEKKETKLLTQANIVTSLRVLGSPVLIFAASQGAERAFLALLLFLLLTDVLDGFLARMSRVQSRYGPRLDTTGDVAMYTCAAVGAWMLRPEVIAREGWFLLPPAGLLLISALYALSKHGHFPTYHTWSAKVSTASIGLSSLILLTGLSAWPYRFSMGLLALAACEDILITRSLDEWRTDVRSVLDLR